MNSVIAHLHPTISAKDLVIHKDPIAVDITEELLTMNFLAVNQITDKSYSSDTLKSIQTALASIQHLEEYYVIVEVSIAKFLKSNHIRTSQDWEDFQARHTK